MKVSEVNRFREQLFDAQTWERKIKPKLKEQVMGISVEQILFDDDPEAQLAGIDQVLTRENLNNDVKIRSNKYFEKPLDIAYEEVSIVADDKPGWVYNDETDVVAYCWKNRVGDNLVDGVILLIDEAFQSWFDGNKDQFDLIPAQSVDERTGQKWTTLNRIVPLSDIPGGFVFEQFNPKLPVDRITDQGKLIDEREKFCYHSGYDRARHDSCPGCGFTCGDGQ